MMMAGLGLKEKKESEPESVSQQIFIELLLSTPQALLGVVESGVGKVTVNNE